MNHFNTGDVVKLKSGSPNMTVRCYKKGTNWKTGEDLISETEVICDWFEGNDKQTNVFHEDQLELVKAAKIERV